MPIHDTKPHCLPQWPAESIDPQVAWVDYAVVADEFLVYFGGKPVPAISSPLDAPGFADVAIMFGLGPDGEATDEIVGVQVIPMMLGAVLERLEWSVLTWAVMAEEYGAELVRERPPGFLDEVREAREAFERYWQPAPPVEEQLAQIALAAEKRQSA